MPRLPRWTATDAERAKPVSAELIARLADRGKDVSRFFKGPGWMIQPIQRVNVDLARRARQPRS